MTTVTSLKTGSVISFAGGALEGRGRIDHVASHEGGWLIIADSTPFHPVSFRWPDQPGDRGKIEFGDGTVAEVIDSLTGLVDAGTGALLIGAEAAAIRKNEGDWHGVVAHIVNSDRNILPYLGAEARFLVDATQRKGLSAAHTAAHLAAFALNEAAAPFWKKDYEDRDTRGRPNFDKAAIQTANITPEASTDVYRLGKSLKKKGIDRDGLLGQLDSVAGEINQRITAWLAKDARVTVTPSEGQLDEVRVWRTELDGAEVSIPCGGTHVAALSEIGKVNVTLTPTEDGFVMTTRVRTE